MSEYPKEVSDALERDAGITFNKARGTRPPDERLAYGVGCTWFGQIQEVGQTGRERLPCCPRCGSLLFEMSNEAEWWTSVDRYEQDGHPGYRAMWEWQRAGSHHFKTVAQLAAAFTAATGNTVKLS